MKKALGTTIALGVILVFFLPDPILHALSSAEVVGMLPAILGFPIFYTYAFPWWREAIGRSLFIFSAGMALLVGVSTLYMIFGDDYFLREQVRFAVFTTILVGAYYQLFVMVRTWKRAGKQFEKRSRHAGEHSKDA